MSPQDIKSVTVVGTGTIGASWTCLFLAHGLDVVATDIREGAAKELEASVERCWSSLPHAVLEKNKAKPGVKVTASGLQYEVLKSGSGGPKPTTTNTVKVHYHGTHIDGKVFDSSVERNEPVEFPVTGVIQGWVEALQLMSVGDKWRLTLPADIAYGEHGKGDIPPHSVLLFDVELLEIK